MNTTDTKPDPQRPMKRLLERVMGFNFGVRSLLFGLLWLGVWRAAVLLEYAPHASIWFPPAGLSFAAFAVVGLRAVPIVMVCAVLSTFWVDRIYGEGNPWDQILLTGSLFAIAHAASYWLGARLLRRLAIDLLNHSLPRLIIAFLALGSLAALLAAALGTQALALTGTISAADATRILLPWWIGDMAGVIVLAPFFIGLISYWYPEVVPGLGGFRFADKTSSKATYALKLTLCLAMLTVAMGLAGYSGVPEASFAVFFLIVPQMWLVYTESAYRTAISVAAFSVLTALLVRSFGLMEQALVYQFAINVIAASAYFGLAVPSLIADNQQLRRIAMTDSLTGIWSRQSVINQARRELLRARRYGEPISVIAFDVDRFKQINDEHGHLVGDQALIDVATTADETLRGTDILGRIGGDEFVAILPKTDLAQARETANRIREALLALRVSQTDQPVSGSFGVAEAGAEESFRDIFERADQALYAAKNNGRNQVQWSGSTELQPAPAAGA